MTVKRPDTIDYIADLRGETARLPARLSGFHFFFWFMVLNVVFAVPVYLGLAYWWQLVGGPEDGESPIFLSVWFFLFSIAGGFGWAMICEMLIRLLPIRSYGLAKRKTLSLDNLLVGGPALAIIADGFCMLPLVNDVGSRVIVGLEVAALKCIVLFLGSWRLSRLKGVFTIDQATVRFRPSWTLYPKYPSVSSALNAELTVKFGSSNEGLILNGIPVGGTEGLQPSERQWLLEWLVEHVGHTPNEEVHSGQERVPDALTALRGQSPKEDAD